MIKFPEMRLCRIKEVLFRQSNISTSHNSHSKSWTSQHVECLVHEISMQRKWQHVSAWQLSSQPRGQKLACLSYEFTDRNSPTVKTKLEFRPVSLGACAHTYVHRPTAQIKNAMFRTGIQKGKRILVRSRAVLCTQKPKIQLVKMTIIPAYHNTHWNDVTTHRMKILWNSMSMHKAIAWHMPSKSGWRSSGNSSSKCPLAVLSWALSNFLDKTIHG